MKPQRFSFDLPYDPASFTVAPSGYTAARATSALAAIQAQPKRATQNTVLMALLEAAGDVGLSDIEIQQRTGWLRQSICARRRDCRSQIEPAGRHEHHGFSYTRWRMARPHGAE